MALYKNVNDMVHGLFGDDSESVVADMKKVGDACRVVHFLVQTRVTEGLRQSDIAKAMGVSASTVSRIEDSADADLKYGTIMAYMRALGLNFSFDAGVSGTPATHTAEKVSRHGNLGRRPLASEYA